jgi:ABC-2 type transport system permease protein
MLTLLLGKSADIKDVAVTIGTQLIWLAVTYAISKLFWKISLPQITVNGG